MKWRTVWTIAKKDIVDAIRNSYILFGLVLPLGIGLLFRVVFPSEASVNAMTVAVYDADHSRLVEQLRALPEVRLLEVSSVEEVSAHVRNEAVGGLVLPEGFDAAVVAGQKPELGVHLNGRKGGGEKMAFQWLVERQLWSMAGQELPVRIPTITADLPGGVEGQAEFHLQRYLLGVGLLMAVAMTGTFAVPTLMVEEREKHTLDALLVSPAGAADVVAGKAITGLFYCLVMAGLVLVINHSLVVDWPVTLLATLLGSLFLVLVGLLMGSVCQTMSQVNTWSSVVGVALMMPSWFTILPVPALLQAVLRLLPTHYMMHSLNLSLTQANSLRPAGTDLIVLACSAVLTFGLVAWWLQRLKNRGM